MRRRCLKRFSITGEQFMVIAHPAWQNKLQKTLSGTFMSNHVSSCAKNKIRNLNVDWIPSQLMTTYCTKGNNALEQKAISAPQSCHVTWIESHWYCSDQRCHSPLHDGSRPAQCFQTVMIRVITRGNFKLRPWISYVDHDNSMKVFIVYTFRSTCYSTILRTFKYALWFRPRTCSYIHPMGNDK